MVQIVVSNIVWCKYKATTTEFYYLCKSERENKVYDDKGEGAKVGLQLLSSWYLQLANGSVGVLKEKSERI